WEGQGLRAECDDDDDGAPVGVIWRVSLEQDRNSQQNPWRGVGATGEGRSFLGWQQHQRFEWWPSALAIIYTDANIRPKTATENILRSTLYCGKSPAFWYLPPEMGATGCRLSSPSSLTAICIVPAALGKLNTLPHDWERSLRPQQRGYAQPENMVLAEGQ
ncbi:hypothetical protein H4219_006307, partial [Mycoemilia scoparia]